VECRSDEAAILDMIGNAFVGSGYAESAFAGNFGTGHGSRAHAPDEYCVIESSRPEVRA
jgi:acetylornithine deacetylase/succinyl-diaminopimelate desuccinylase-like protein